MEEADKRFEIPRSADAHLWLAENDGQLSESIRLTQSSPGPANWHIELDAENLYRVEGLHRLSLEIGATQHFSLAPSTDLDDASREFLVDFIRRELFEDGTRTSLQRQADERLLQEIAPRNEAETKSRFQLASRILFRACRALVLDTLYGSHRQPTSVSQMESPVLIGAYGGEHVGDAAILGGVLLGLHAKYGTHKVALGSFRPAHTERLVESLDVPVDVRVFAYEDGCEAEELGRADGLVFAGGPLMDLPDLLVKHWNAALEARRRKLPFVIDRIGVGPFAIWPSRFVARRIARAATSLTVRTAGAAKKPEVRGLDVKVESDPAFPYLESRGADLSDLTRLRSRDQQDVDSILSGAESLFKVGMNLRPIRHLWSPESETESRCIETRCLERIAEAIARIAQQVPSRFVFFPMNPIQLGGSDLHSAWLLHKLVGKRADFRVWQGDPEIDGLLYLLRGLDSVVAMRFHACIFSLSQKIPTIGIDYYAHAGGKVGELFNDFSKSQDATRIDTLETDWLIEKLESMAQSAGYALKTSE